MKRRIAEALIVGLMVGAAYMLGMNSAPIILPGPCAGAVIFMGV